jgi:hypothetical protein
MRDSRQADPELPRALRQLAELFYGNPIDTKKLAKDATMPEEMVRQIVSQYREKKATESDAPGVSSKVVPLKRRS